jgi:hypothetical protein
MIDEAQLTYDSSRLWNSLFKPISARPERYKNRIILFASYGCPIGSLILTNMIIQFHQKATLCPIDHQDGVSRYHFDSTFLCLSLLFDLTLGHMGLDPRNYCPGCASFYLNILDDLTVIQSRIMPFELLMKGSPRTTFSAWWLHSSY